MFSLGLGIYASMIFYVCEIENQLDGTYDDLEGRIPYVVVRRKMIVQDFHVFPYCLTAFAFSIFVGSFRIVEDSDIMVTASGKVTSYLHAKHRVESFIKNRLESFNLASKRPNG